MPSCELCGKEATLLAEIEGAELAVCSECAKYGTVKRRAVTPAALSPPRPKPEEPEYCIVAEYARLLRTSREHRKLSQQDFAKLLNERESSVAKWEAGLLKPSIETARKLEKKLGLKLVEVEETASGNVAVQRKSGELTLGDLVKIRKRD